MRVLHKPSALWSSPAATGAQQPQTQLTLVLFVIFSPWNFLPTFFGVVGACIPQKWKKIIRIHSYWSQRGKRGMCRLLFCFQFVKLANEKWVPFTGSSWSVVTTNLKAPIWNEFVLTFFFLLDIMNQCKMKENGVDGVKLRDAALMGNRDRKIQKFSFIVFQLFSEQFLTISEAF